MKKSKFVPGETYARVSGKVFDEEEINNAIKVARDGWWIELGKSSGFLTNYSSSDPPIRRGVEKFSTTLEL